MKVVLGVGGGAEHLVGDGEEQAAVGDEGVVGHAEMTQLLLHRRTRPWRVGQEHDDAALGTKRPRGGDGTAERNREPVKLSQIKDCPCPKCNPGAEDGDVNK